MRLVSSLSGLKLPITLELLHSGQVRHVPRHLLLIQVGYIRLINLDRRHGRASLIYGARLRQQIDNLIVARVHRCMLRRRQE